MPLRVPYPTTSEIAEAVWENLARTLTDPDSYKADVSALDTPSDFRADVSSLIREIEHDTYVFPEDTDEFITFTAGAVDNAWSDWAEIVDGSANKFSDKATTDLHISALMIENTNIKDETYMIEIAYGDDKTPVTPYRFIAGETTKLPAVQLMRVRADHILAEETIYYRMKCETGGKTCDLHIRYHLHEG